MQLLIHPTWVVVDLETTGVSHAKGDRIVEIGAVRLEGDRVTGEFQTLVNPQRPIPYYAQRVHGISDRMVASVHHFGISLEGDRHRALADARATAHLWVHLRRLAQVADVPLRGLLKN